VIAAVAFASLSGTDPTPSASASDPGAPLSFAAPGDVAAQTGPCAKVLAQLPVTLDKLAPRVVHTRPETPYVVAWGDPAVVLRCGVDRPKSLVANSAAQFFSGTGESGPFYDVTDDGTQAKVYTSVDRAAYISITIPRTYAAAPLPALSTAIAKALPAVCSTDPTSPRDQLCTRRP
jgi:hypothetical protein